MDEEAFRAFYDRTARSLWFYLSRMTGDSQVADDLLQESYYRFLRSRGSWESEATAAPTSSASPPTSCGTATAGPGTGTRSPLPESDHSTLARARHRPGGSERRSAPTCGGRWAGCGRASGRCCGWPTPRATRTREIADTLGVKTASVKLLLFRARRKLADMLRRRTGPRRTEGPIVRTVECCREEDVLDALTSGRWPERAPVTCLAPRRRVRDLQRHRWRSPAASSTGATTRPRCASRRRP